MATLILHVTSSSLPWAHIAYLEHTLRTLLHHLKGHQPIGKCCDEVSLLIIGSWFDKLWQTPHWLHQGVKFKLTFICKLGVKCNSCPNASTKNSGTYRDHPKTLTQNIFSHIYQWIHSICYGLHLIHKGVRLTNARQIISH